MTHGYSYQAALDASSKVNWKIEDIIGGDKTLDFSKYFLPESLARTSELTFLSDREQIVMNQIRGCAYLCIFGLVEEFILPFVMDHSRPNAADYDDVQVRAFLQFASEEAKHIHLFKTFKQEFEKGFGTHCDVIGPPHEIADAVLAHHPLAVALVILHIEWMTQRHYVDSIRDNDQMDAQFKSLLKHHWLEEAQHAKLDTLMVEEIAAAMSAEEIAEAMEDYLKIGMIIDGGLAHQVKFDLDAFQRATGRMLSEDEAAKYRESQLAANRWTYLGTGMTHKNFLDTLSYLGEEHRRKIEEVAPAFC